MLKLSGPTINATNLELVSLATLKTYLAQTSTTNDTILQALLDNTHRQLYAMLGNRMVKRVNGTPWVYLLDGGMDAIELPQYPLITSTCSISYGYIEDKDNAWKELQAFGDTDWHANTDWGMIYHTSGGWWPGGRNMLKVTFEAGFASCPEDLRDAVCQWAAVKFQRYLTKRWDVSSITKEGEGMSFRESEIPREARLAIRSYERSASGIC